MYPVQYKISCTLLLLLSLYILINVPYKYHILKDITIKNFVYDRRSSVSLSDMLEAVIFLKDLELRGLVVELSRGVWLRAPVTNWKQSPKG